MKRGSFISVKSWSDVTANRAVYRDGKGEYTRLFSGGVFRKDSGFAGRMGVVVDAMSGLKRLVRLDNGKTVELSAEVLNQIHWDTNRMCWA